MIGTRRIIAYAVILFLIAYAILPWIVPDYNQSPRVVCYAISR